MRDIGCYTGAAFDVVERKLGDARIELQEEGQRLADTTAGTEDDDFRRLDTVSTANITDPLKPAGT